MVIRSKDRAPGCACPECYPSLLARAVVRAWWWVTWPPSAMWRWFVPRGLLLAADWTIILRVACRYCFAFRIAGWLELHTERMLDEADFLFGIEMLSKRSPEEMGL